MDITKIKNKAFLTALLIFASYRCMAQGIDHWETMVYASDTWKYFIGVTEPPADWITVEFDDNLWAEDAAGIGYGDEDDATEINQTISLYMRIKFSIIDTAVISRAVFNLDYDDAFVAYLNGTEIARANIGSPGDRPAYNQTSTGFREAAMYQGGTPEYFYFPSDSLKPGDNVLAIQVHNQDINSSDMSAIPFISAGISDISFTYRETPSWFNAPFDFVSSNLPVIVINTDGQEIVYEPKITSTMGIVNNPEGQRNYVSGPYNEYSGMIGIEIRGQTSRGFDKKSFGLETRDSIGENLNIPLLGLPRENDWVLYGPESDKTLMRNALTYTLAGQLGRYAPRVRFCELVLNGEYQGVYVFTEKIKRDNDRIDITEMVPEDINEPEVTGGYIFKQDKINEGDNIIALSRGLELIITEPKIDSILPEQTNWLINHLNEFEDVLYSGGNYSKYIDLTSFVDNFLMVELTKNIDGYRLSTYFHKDRNGKIVAAPVWDYNLSLGNADYSYGWTAEGWYWPIIQSWNKNWWMILNEEPNFQDLCKTRWTNLRTTVLSEMHIFSLIDEWTVLLEESQQRNFVTYPILGTYIWPNPGFPESGSFGYDSPTTGGPTTWAEDLEQMKAFISSRLVWMDENMPGRYIPTSLNEAEHVDEDIYMSPFPNPFNSSCRISFIVNKPGPVSINIYDVLGKIIKSETIYSSGAGTEEYTWDGSGDLNKQVASSVYFYVIIADKQIVSKGKLVKID